MDSSIEGRVAAHYGRADLEAVIVEALAAAGKDPERLTVDDLAPVDEFHVGGRQATVAFADAVGFPRGAHLLDIGCGIGGPSRYFAAHRGCRVTGIDLTDDFVRTAEKLALRVGLAGAVAYRQASALDLPFADGTFDGAYMMHVGMNIEDKPRLFAQVRRVVKPGGMFAIYDIMRIGDGPLRYPVHWAASPETSFVASPADYRRALEGAGFTIVKERDRHDFALEAMRQAAASARAAGGAPPLGIHLLMQRDVPDKVANVIAAMEAKLIAPMEIISRAQ